MNARTTPCFSIRAQRLMPYFDSLTFVAFLSLELHIAENRTFSSH